MGEGISSHTIRMLQRISKPMMRVGLELATKGILFSVGCTYINLYIHLSTYLPTYLPTYL